MYWETWFKEFDHEANPNFAVEVLIYDFFIIMRLHLPKSVPSSYLFSARHCDNLRILVERVNYNASNKWI